jgi:hypothetical protein
MLCFHQLQAGEVGTEMYILEYGVAAVTTTVTAAAATTATVSAAATKRATVAVVATLSTGDYCGEAALLTYDASDTISNDSGSSSSSSVHVRTVTAKSYCDAFALAATDFVEVSTAYITAYLQN